MKILQNKIKDYTFANFSEDETVWDSALTYNYEQSARDGHFIYAYAGTDGTNSTLRPSEDWEKLPKERVWIKIRPTNYYAMLDGETQTQTRVKDVTQIEFPVNNYDAIALLDIVAESVHIELIDSVTWDVLYEHRSDMLDYTGIVDFYSYCFNTIEHRPSLYLDSLPLFNNALVRLTIENAGGTAACGRLVCGRTHYVGETGYGANLTQESYSKKERDIFGNTTLVHSNSLNLDSYEVYVPTQSIPNTRRKFKELDAVAILFIMDEQENSKLENLLNFGYYQSFSILIPDDQLSTASLQIKGIL